MMDSGNCWLKYFFFVFFSAVYLSLKYLKPTSIIFYMLSSMWYKPFKHVETVWDSFYMKKYLRKITCTSTSTLTHHISRTKSEIKKTKKCPLGNGLKILKTCLTLSRCQWSICNRDNTNMIYLTIFQLFFNFFFFP